jgi:hypothetical protein
LAKAESVKRSISGCACGSDFGGGSGSNCGGFCGYLSMPFPLFLLSFQSLSFFLWTFKDFQKENKKSLRSLDLGISSFLGGFFSLIFVISSSIFLHFSCQKVFFG